jgi:hypothetical protein
MKFTPYLTITLIIIALILIGYSALGQVPAPPKLLQAIHQVEASGRLHPPRGDDGKALGPFQIHYAYWLDSGVKGSYSQCSDYEYSVKVVTGYFNRYGKKFLIDGNLEALARIHNGGPLGYKSNRTLNYWNKVKKHL